MFGNLGLGEILIILVLILILFGPNKIPELAGTVGRTINQFRRQMDEAQRAVIDPIRADFHGSSTTPGAHTLGGNTLGANGAASPTPPATYDLGPAPLTEEEERARQPKRLLD